jgi:hypothetical protein
MLIADQLLPSNLAAKFEPKMGAFFTAPFSNATIFLAIFGEGDLPFSQKIFGRRWAKDLDLMVAFVLMAENKPGGVKRQQKEGLLAATDPAAPPSIRRRRLFSWELRSPPTKLMEAWDQK